MVLKESEKFHLENLLLQVRMREYIFYSKDNLNTENNQKDRYNYLNGLLNYVFSLF